MAINYTNLFADIGEVVLAIEELEAMMVTVESRRSSVITQFSSSSVTGLVTSINQTFDSITQQLTSQTSQLKNLVSERLKDRDTVTEELPDLTSTSIDQIIEVLIADMKDNSQTVKKATVTLTPGTAITTNTDVGELILSKTLPGNVSPGRGFRKNVELAGVDSELPLDDSLVIQCVADSQEGAAEGTETFQISGIIPSQDSPFASNQGGNPGTTNLSVANSSSVISNFFETFVSDLPTGWTLSVGAAGTAIEENVVVANVMHGASSLAIKAGQVPELEFDIFSLIRPNALMTLYFYLKRAATAGGSIDVDLDVGGTSLVSDTITVDAGLDNWALQSYTFVIPANLGSEATLKFTGAVTTADLYVDGGALSVMTQHAGIGFAVTRGQNKFLVGDKFPVAVANDEIGKFQRFFVRAMKYQLPSASSGHLTEPS